MKRYRLAGIRWLSDSERGQMIVLSALVMTVVLVFSALAIDVGVWMHTRTKLQADADAMALAGAQELCAKSECDDEAEDIAWSYGPQNDVANSEVDYVGVGTRCDGTTSSNHDVLTVKTERTVSTFLAHLAGIVDQDIEACATARKAAIAGGTGVVPFGIEDDCIAGAEFGEDYTIKYDAGPDVPDPSNPACDSNNGNFGLLGIDTGGAGSGCGDPPDTLEELKLKRAICFGASRFLCAQDASECTGEADDEPCGSEGIPTDEESCTQTGNVSSIKEAIDWRIDNTSEDCDTWEDVTFEGDPTAVPPTKGGLDPVCNPWLNEESKRVIMIPIVDGLFVANGSDMIDIVGFALFFLDGLDDCSGGGPGGGNCAIVGKFIATSLSASYEGLDDLDEESSLTVVILVN
jgi:hypothetical protein